MYLHQCTSEIVENIQKREQQLGTLETEIEAGQDQRTTEMKKLQGYEEQLMEVRDEQPGLRAQVEELRAALVE